MLIKLTSKQWAIQHKLCAYVHILNISIIVYKTISVILYSLSIHKWDRGNWNRNGRKAPICYLLFRYVGWKPKCFSLFDRKKKKSKMPLTSDSDAIHVRMWVHFIHKEPIECTTMHSTMNMHIYFSSRYRNFASFWFRFATVHWCILAF